MSKAVKLVKKVVKSPIGQIGIGLLAPYAAPALGITSAVGTGLFGAGVGGLSGALSGNGLKGILSGATIGGLGGYLGAGGLSSPASESLNPLTGSGFSNIANSGIKTATAPIGGTIGGTLSSYAKSPLFKNALSGAVGYQGNEKAEDQLIEAQRKRAEALAPYLNQKYTPGDLSADPGYQFRLQQGNQALDRVQASRGNYFSGQALKDATDYSQNLAAEENQNAFQRWLTQNAQNINTAGAVGNIYGDIGDVKANATINNSNLLSRSLSGILGGTGYSNTASNFDSGIDIDMLKRLGYI